MTWSTFRQAFGPARSRLIGPLVVLGLLTSSAMVAETAQRGTENAAEGVSAEQRLRSAEIQIDVMKQAVLEALQARAEAEAALEMLRQDDAAKIEALTAGQQQSEARSLTLMAELAAAKGEIAVLGEEVERLTVESASFQNASLDDGDDDADAKPVSSRSGGLLNPIEGGSGEFQVGEIHFNSGSADLTPGAMRKTLEAAERIQSMEIAEVRVVGYTDTAGGADFNKHLSLRRADSIAELLAEVGVARDMIRIDGRGEDGIPEVTDDQISEPLNRCASIHVVMASPK